MVYEDDHFANQAQRIRETLSRSYDEYECFCGYVHFDSEGRVRTDHIPLSRMNEVEA